MKLNSLPGAAALALSTLAAQRNATAFQNHTGFDERLERWTPLPIKCEDDFLGPGDPEKESSAVGWMLLAGLAGLPPSVDARIECLKTASHLQGGCFAIFEGAMGSDSHIWTISGKFVGLAPKQQQSAGISPDFSIEHLINNGQGAALP